MPKDRCEKIHTKEFSVWEFLTAGNMDVFLPDNIM